MMGLKRGPTPLYHQIGAILRERIATGELQTGDRVPSEEELRRMFGVSRATCRQALQELEQNKLISREPGRGSFVRRSEGEVTEVKVTCLLEDLIALGVPAVNRVVGTGVVHASPIVARALGLGSGDATLTFLRIVEVEGQPFAANRVFLPAWMAGRLTETDMANMHLLKTLEAKCGIAAHQAEQIIEAIMADASQANLLDVDAGAALLSVTRTTYDPTGRAVEHSTTLYRSDRTRFHLSQLRRRKEATDWVLDRTGPVGARDSQTIVEAKRGRRHDSRR